MDERRIVFYTDPTQGVLYVKGYFAPENLYDPPGYLFDADEDNADIFADETEADEVIYQISRFNTTFVGGAPSSKPPKPF